MTDEQRPVALEVGLDEMVAHQEAGGLVVDVRERDEYATAHVPGVTLVPLSELQERWRELPTDQTIYVICAAGGRSRKAANALLEVGIDAVNVAPGTAGWIKEGRPVETGE